MLLYDKTHAAYAGSFAPPRSSTSVHMDPFKLLINGRPMIFFTTGKFLIKGKREESGIFLNQHGVWFEGEIDLKTLTVTHRYPTPLNKVGVYGKNNRDSNLFMCSMVNAAIRKHGWGVKTLFEKLQQGNSLWVTSLWTIEELIKEVKNITLENVNYQLIEDSDYQLQED